MATKLPLSVTLMTFNNERTLPATLESVADLAAEIIVVDSFSSDRTVECAKRFGARIEQRPWAGFLGQKQFAHDLCTQGWILNLDADEVPSPELRTAIRAAIEENNPSVVAFECNRKSYYLNRWIEHSWNPDRIVRLARRGQAQWGGTDLHPRLIPGGNVRRLDGNLLHYPYGSLHAHLERILKYGRMNAELLKARGVQARWHHLLLHPLWALLKKLVLKQAWRDGMPGLLIALSSFVMVFAKYAYLWEMQHSVQHPSAAASERVNKDA